MKGRETERKVSNLFVESRSKRRKTMLDPVDRLGEFRTSSPCFLVIAFTILKKKETAEPQNL